MLKNILTRIIENRPHNRSNDITRETTLIFQATYNYGVSLYHLGQDWAYDRAMEIFKKILDEPLSNSTNLIETRELAQGSLACTYAKLVGRRPEQKEKFYNLAMDQTESLLNTSKNNAAKALAFAATGLVYLGFDNINRALDSFDRSIELDPNLTAHLGMGDAYQRTGKTEEAIEAYQKADDLTSGGGYASYRLGNLYRETGHNDKAVESYKKAASLSVAQLSLGKIHSEAGELEDALEAFRSAVRINRKNSEALINIAWTILEMQNLNEDLINESVEVARRAAQIDTGGKHEWHRRSILALCLLEAQKLDLAFKEAQTGLNLAPDKAQAKFSVALCEFHLNRLDSARTILLDILQSNERGLWRNKAERLMREIQLENG